jgi:hypothetical protein
MTTLETILILIPENQKTFTHASYPHKKWIDSRELAELRINELIKEKLTEYTDFLLKEGYCDTDVYCEPPTAVDQFLNPKLR